MQGMVLGGTSSKLGDDDPTLNCRRVERPSETCELNAALKSFKARRDYATGGRNTLLFFTYAFFIVPGVLIHILLNGERDEIASDDDQVYRDAIALCAKP